MKDFFGYELNSFNEGNIPARPKKKGAAPFLSSLSPFLHSMCVVV